MKASIAAMSDVTAVLYVAKSASNVALSTGISSFFLVAALGLLCPLAPEARAVVYGLFLL